MILALVYSLNVKVFNKMNITFRVDCHQQLNVLSSTDGDPPISPFQLPAYCGYSVKMSWSDVKLTISYNACYMTQEVLATFSI